MYKKEEDVSFDIFNNLIMEINSTYNTDNKMKLNNVLMSIQKKERVLSTIHSNNVYVLKTKIKQHYALKRLNISILGQETNIDIGDSIENI